ncbi:glycosyltransferase family 4 protein [Leifsonia flava]|uniref:D-inositol 3-phosphate glycosyltransferase n=1 Tax=Orlajensenia leifsoniae TaxID=2561933 RepID=A0A4Y9QQT7_9MICO|nr:glycosyltransferase family 4 protein [Leifsonia flava]TFV94949.1 glycosyltransferase WbuB [Leifsonia flava]
MRVTLVSRIFSPEAAAASFRLLALTRALVAGGDRVEVLTTTIPPALRSESGPDAPGMRVRRAPVLRDRSGYLRGYLQYMSFDVPAFFRVLFTARGDVVVVEPPPTTGLLVRVACDLRRLPYVYYAADIWSDATAATDAPRPVVVAVRWIEARALRGARRVLAVNDGVRDRVLMLAPRADVVVVPNGIDTEIFTPAGDVDVDAPWGVYAGTTSEWQGADIFIRAMPAVLVVHPDARIAFLGQGSAWGALERLASDLAPGAVEFHGSVPPAEAARWLRSARAGLVSLMPGQGYDFALPTKIFASSATGTPVVFAGLGPSRSVIAAGSLGTAVDYDIDSVANALIDAFGRARDTRDREIRAQWVADNASSSARAREAAAVVRSGAGSERA